MYGCEFLGLETQSLKPMAPEADHQLEAEQRLHLIDKRMTYRSLGPGGSQLNVLRSSCHHQGSAVIASVTLSWSIMLRKNCAGMHTSSRLSKSAARKARKWLRTALF